MSSCQAVFIRGKGGPEVLEIAEYEMPTYAADEVLVHVHAVGLNRADTLQRRGFYPAPPGIVADVPGLEFAGTVEAIGGECNGVVVGDRVMGIVSGGAFATHVKTKAAELMKVPEGMSFAQAAAIPEVFLTAYDAMFIQAGVHTGETALVHAIASGIGTAALQLAAAHSVQLIGTSRSQEKLDRLQDMGLQHGILVSEALFAEQVKGICASGADVIFDTVGAKYLGENIKALALKGRMVTIGLLGGAKGELNLGALLAKRGTLMGSVLRSRSADEKAELTTSFRQDVLPGFVTGALKPVIDEVWPMARIQEAHTRMDANQTLGKIVLEWS